jgi:SAM-dependent methyltransferase
MMAKFGADVVAVEPNAAAVKQMQTDGLPISPIIAGGENAQLAARSFDCATFFFSLHHIPEQALRPTLSNVRQALRPGGIIYIVEPVAVGPAFRVIKMVDDETKARANALETLEAWLAGQPPATVSERLYKSYNTYPDFSAYCSSLLRGDSNRQLTIDTHRQKLQALFEQEADSSPQGYSLAAVTRAIKIII